MTRAVLTTLVVMLGCGTTEPEVESGPVELELAPMPSVVELSDTLTLVVSAVDAAGAAVSTVGTLFASADPTVVNVDPTRGVLVAIGEGPFSVTATLNTLTAEASSLVRDTEGPKAVVLESPSGIVSGEVIVQVELHDPSGVRAAELWANGGLLAAREILSEPFPATVTVTLRWDTTQRPNGTYGLAVHAYDLHSIMSSVDFIGPVTVANP